MVNPALLMLNLPFRQRIAISRASSVVMMSSSRATITTGSLHTGFFLPGADTYPRETGADMVMTADEFCHIQIRDSARHIVRYFCDCAMVFSACANQLRFF